MGITSWQTKKKYNDKVYTQMNLRIKKEIAEPFKALCERQGLSYTKVISDYMIEYMRFWDDIPLIDRSDLSE